MIRHSGLRKFTLLATSSLAVMSGSALAPALPAIRGAFADDPAAGFLVRLLLTIPALVIVVCAPVMGYVIDRFGRKRVLLFSLVLFAASGSTGLYFDTLPLLIAGRAMLGVAVAGCLTVASTLIADYYADEQRSRILGAQAVAMALGGVLYLTVSGRLADWHWRAPFLLFLFPLFLIPGALLAIREPLIAHRKPASGDGDAPEKRARIPRWILVVYLLAFFAMVNYYMLPVDFAFHLEALLGMGGTESGLALAFATLVSAGSSALFPWVHKRLHSAYIFALTFLGIGAGYLVLALSHTFPLVLLGVVVAGFGMGFNLPNANMWVAEITPLSYRGRALGGLATSLYLGQFLCPVFTQPFVERWGLAATFQGAGMTLILVAMGVTALILFFKRRNVRSTAA
jgi:MFS family permease